MAMSATVRLALAATAAPSILIIRSHASITSHCCGLDPAIRNARFSACEERDCAQSSSGVIAPGWPPFPMSGAMSGVWPARGRHPKVHPKAEPTVIASRPISNSFFAGSDP